MLPPRQQTARLLLCPVLATDHPYVAAGLTDPKVYITCGIRYTDALHALEQMDWYATNHAKGTGVYYAIHCQATSAFVGVVSLYYIDKTHKTAELGYWLLPAHWGKGYAKEAVQAMTDYAFGPLGLNRVEAVVETTNPASNRILEATGFMLEGRKRQAEWKDGRFIDLLVYSLLRQDWALQKSI